jgi:hypothetical protein
MSITPESPSPQLPPPARRSGCLTAFMVIAGLILLLPGLCAVFFGANEFTSPASDPVVTLLVVIGLALGALGVGMIWSAIRGRRE